MKRRNFIQNSGALLAAAPFMNFAAGGPWPRKCWSWGSTAWTGHRQPPDGPGPVPNMQRLGEKGVFTMMRSTVRPKAGGLGSFISGADPGFSAYSTSCTAIPKLHPHFSQSETLPSR